MGARERPHQQPWIVGPPVTFLINQLACEVSEKVCEGSQSGENQRQLDLIRKSSTKSSCT